MILISPPLQGFGDKKMTPDRPHSCKNSLICDALLFKQFDHPCALAFEVGKNPVLSKFCHECSSKKYCEYPPNGFQKHTGRRWPTLA